MTTVNQAIFAPASAPAPASPEAAAPEGEASFGATLERALAATPGQSVQAQRDASRATQGTRAAQTTATTSAAARAESIDNSPGRATTTGSMSAARVDAPVEAQATAPVETQPIESHPVEVDAEVELSSEAVAAFLAIFLAMAAKQATPIEATPDTSAMQVEATAMPRMGRPGESGDSEMVAQIRSTAQALAQLAVGSGRGDLAEAFFDALVQGLTGQTVVSDAEPTAPLQQLIVELPGDDPLRALLERLTAAIEVSASEDAQQAFSSRAEAAAVFAAALAQVNTSQDDEARRDDVSDRRVASAASLRADAQIAQAASELVRALAATARVSAAQAKADVATERLVDAIEDAQAIAAMAEVGQKLNLGRVDGSSHVKIQLEPEELGIIQVQVHRTADGVTAHVATTTEAGRQVVEQSLDAIQAALREAGVEVDSIRVTGPSLRTEATSFESVLKSTRPAQADSNESRQPVARIDQPTSGDTRPVAGPNQSRAEEVQPIDQPASDVTRPMTPIDQPASGVTRPTTTAAATRVEAAESVDGVTQAAQATTSSEEGTATPRPIDESTTSQAQPIGGASQAVRSEGTIVAEAAAPVRDTASRLVRDIADQAGVLAGQGKSEFRIQLRPEALGQLQIRLTLEDGAVTVRMTAESTQAKASLESNLGQLKQAFQDQGIRADRFMVMLGQSQFGQDNQHPRRSRGWVDQVRSVRRVDGDFAAALASAGSSRAVNYLA